MKFLAMVRLGLVARDGPPCTESGWIAPLRNTSTNFSSRRPCYDEGRRDAAIAGFTGESLPGLVGSNGGGSRFHRSGRGLLVVDGRGKSGCSRGGKNYMRWER
jgi:hypothetical protein